MKLTIKTLQGVAFSLDAELTDAVLAVKQKIEEMQQFPVTQQKLIHAGKVLKDDSTLAEYNVKENDFLVVMVTKPKAAKPPSAAAATTTSSASTAPASATTAAAAVTPISALAPNTSSASSSTSATAPAVSTPSAAPATTAVNSSTGDGSNVMSAEQMGATVQQLVDMGFPEDQVRSALRAAFNNPERAVEYLMTGIPDQVAAPLQTAATLAGAGAVAGIGGGDETTNTLEALRNHPQFDALRQLVQSNPAALPAVLQQIGAQSPELLRLIHQNQDRFVQMLNEPIGTRETGSASSSAGAAPFDLGMGGGGGMPTPQQIQQLVDSLTPEQQTQMAAQMGMSPEQLRGLSQMLSNLPPGAMEQMMASMGGGGLEGLGGGAGAGTGAGAGGHRIMLSEEEAAAVDRLCEMGFERTDVIQAYLACDKNEALAANFLMDSGDSFGGGATGGAGGHGDDNDDIYG
ncbi:unnamed protein product [Peronospora farinosa]|uniref:UV excision repair protein RAD23 n=1 Tax=Peronospora farinosa TaxID=134698 RepID=A0AAV0T2L8_9STRA|nr:unnamed protein product [Peronospora farinosa]CAI5711199.1 unnamed protein product [Peronospora farinosa]